MQGVELVNHWLLNEPEKTWIDFAKPKPIAVTSLAEKYAGDGSRVPEKFYSKSGTGLIHAGERQLTLRR